ncbi:MAG: hypothetical protein KGJ61_00955 [Candidatus Omnitrophica bacterium]|nr:hypothetical protein [Candidatus Omnitrophota bacterium]
MRSSFNRRGTTLLEAAGVLFIITAVLSTLIPACITRINQARYDKTVSELTAIAQASVSYLSKYGAGNCPALGGLVPDFLPPGFVDNAGVASSPFGTSYNQPVCSNNLVTASVLIPAGIGSNDSQGQLIVETMQGSQKLIEISKPIWNEYTVHLSYCLKYGCV